MKLSKIHNGIKVAVVLGGLSLAIPAVWAQGIGLRALEDAMVSTKFKVERGEKIYDQNCVRCHGPDGAGQTEFAQKLEQPPPNLAEGEYRWSGGKVGTYNVISKGTNGHPLFSHIPYQDRWAVTHYVRSLGPTDQYEDDPKVVEQARFEAEKGTCDPSVRSGIADKMAFKGEEQVALAQKAYAANCSSCHGAEGGGDGPAAAALDPKPRNFTSADEEWTKGTSPLAIFDVLSNGVEGTSMAAFSHLPEKERWAMVHLIREEWLPDSQKEEATEEQIAAVCRTLSASGSEESIPVAAAMRFLAEDIEKERALRYARYGTSWVSEKANASAGKKLYTQHCQSCHGPQGAGAQLGPYGAFPPYLFVEVGPLQPASAGGTFLEFAKRSIKGAHVSLPDMTGASQLSTNDWMALQSYVAGFKGEGTVKPMSQRTAEAGESPAEGAPVEGAAAEGATDGESAEEDAAQPAAEQPSEPESERTENQEPDSAPEASKESEKAAEQTGEPSEDAPTEPAEENPSAEE